MSKQKSVEIIISKSDDCIFHGAKLAEVLSKYRWVEYAFNTCHYDAERNEVFFDFSKSARYPTLFPNLLDCYHINEDGATWEKEFSEIHDCNESDILDTETYDIEFRDLVEDISACIDKGSIELSLLRSNCNNIETELIHVNSKFSGYRKSMQIGGSLNGIYSYEEV
jgi:hypothetical protein